MVDEKRLQVCRQAFLSLHAISQKRVRRLQTLLALGRVPNDERGHQHNRKEHSGEVIQEVVDHINSFPLKQSHYTDKQYLDERLSVKKMFSLFKEKYPETVVKYEFYYKIFKGRFGYSFGKPQIDTCCECEALNVKVKSRLTSLNPFAKRVAMAELIVHKRRSEKFYKEMKETEKVCQNDERVLGLSFDYMQNIGLPNIPVQDLFYLRQLSVFPFCIHNLKDGKAHFYLYHEGEAKKGPDETCSFLLHYIKNNVPGTVKELHLYSDSCGGQNKNHTLLRFCLALTDLNMFEKIIHRFPKRGHSFLPCDRDFGHVKKFLKKHDRYYTPKQICEMIITSVYPGKFTVHMVQPEYCFQFKDWWPKYYKKNCNSLETSGPDTHRDKRQCFTISKFMEFQYDHKRKGTITVSLFIGRFQQTFAVSL